MSQTESLLPTPAAIREQLDKQRAGSGYLLAHHGAMAASMPDLHAAYGAMYSVLTLTDRHLSAFEREFIWLCILVAGREAVGTHHAAKFLQTGGTQAQARVALQLTGYAGAADALAFGEQHWRSFFPDVDPYEGYCDGVRTLSARIVPVGLCHLALAAVHTILRQDVGLGMNIRAVYSAAEPEEDKLVEALSLAMWPGGVNRFVQACTLWHSMMRDGLVKPSARFQAWADTPGIGPFAQPAGDATPGSGAP